MQFQLDSVINNRGRQVSAAATALIVRRQSRGGEEVLGPSVDTWVTYSLKVALRVSGVLLDDLTPAGVVLVGST